MKKGLFILVTAIIVIAIFWVGHPLSDEILTPTPDDPRIPKYERIEYEGNAFHVVYVNLQKQDLKMYYKNPAGQRYGSISSLQTELKNQGENLVFATNGGIYAEDFSPLGLYIEDAEQISKLNTSKASTGNFFLQPNGVFEISGDTHSIQTTSEWKAMDRQSDYAVQSGPMLVIDGVINAKFTANSENKLIRSGVGSISNFEIVFVLSSDPVNFYEFASFFKDHLGASRALYLDGTISDMYVDGVYLGNLQGEYSTIIGVTIHE
ncbi:MAG: phosphodiester glycosidase family protein [Patescibacteria group bacterium]